MGKKRAKKNKLKLFHNATIAMSLMSWYTTFNGFKDSVFANGQGLVAGLSSMAIQVILLGGILNIVPITIDMWYKMRENKTESQEEKNWWEFLIKYLKKTPAFLGFALKFSIIWGTFLLAMVTSITFSYIDIANNIYATDYSVNANIKLDEFMRTTIQGMETDNQEYLDGMRERLIKELKENGEDILKKSAKKRGEEYAQTTAKLLYLERTEELISLDDEKVKFENKDLLREKFFPNTKAIYKYHFIKKSYVDKLYKDFIREHDLGNTPFSNGLKNKINNLNRDKLAIFSEYYFQYTVAVKTYNSWLKKLEKGNKDSKAPSLEKMRSLSDFCNSIKSGLEDVEKAIGTMSIEKAKENTKRIKSEAIQNMDSLKLETDNVKNKVDLLIKYTYFGENSLSFEQLISAFGSSETTLETLDQARKQLLEMQGVFLAEEKGNDQEQKKAIDKVTDLIHDIEKYIEAVRYDKKLQFLKQKINTNYNIVKDVKDSDLKSKKTDQMKNVSESAVSKNSQKEGSDQETANTKEKDNIKNDKGEDEKTEAVKEVKEKNQEDKTKSEKEKNKKTKTKADKEKNKDDKTKSEKEKNKKTKTKADNKKEKGEEKNEEEKADEEEDKNDDEVDDEEENGTDQEEKEKVSNEAGQKEDKIVDNEEIAVVNVTSEQWTNEKKKQMAELEGMIFNHPVNLYCPEVKKDEIKDDITQSPPPKASPHPNDVKKIQEKHRLHETKSTSNKIIDFLLHRESEDITPEEKKFLEGEENMCWYTYYQYKADAVEYRKLYLDTSEMEKAYNLLAGATGYFPYKGKVLIAFVFAVFLDFGAFLLGVVMFFSKKGKQKEESKP